MPYLDRTFCASNSCDGSCSRKLTAEHKAEANKLGMPIAMSYFCNYEEEIKQAMLDKSKADAAIH